MTTKKKKELPVRYWIIEFEEGEVPRKFRHKDKETLGQAASNAEFEFRLGPPLSMTLVEVIENWLVTPPKNELTFHPKDKFDFL